MGSADLTKYIKEKLSQGYDNDTIYATLSKKGCDKTKIELAINEISSKKPLKKAKNTKPPSSPLLNLLLNPSKFFTNTNINLINSIKYISYSFLMVFLIRILIRSIQSTIQNKPLKELFMLLLTETVYLLFFFIAIALFFTILAVTCLFLFSFINKTCNLLLVLTLLIFSAVPYLLISSISSLGIYNMLVLANINIGFLNINIFLLWSMFLFSIALSKNLDVSLRNTTLLVFIPFLLLSAVLTLVFYDITKINLLWLVFESF